MTAVGDASIRFDDRVAIVTGAGGNPGLGRSYAMLLARLGARVLVNDVGAGFDGLGTRPVSAEAVVAEIVAAGGEAVADNGSVADAAGAREVVAHAIDTWGRLDIVINNAGVNLPSPFDEISEDDIHRLISVHLMGTIWMCRAVWPQMKAQQYGRIVNTASGTMFGYRDLAVYGAAKGGVVSLSRTLAIEGASEGIRVNVVSPSAATAATTQLTGVALPAQPPGETSPDGVAPIAAYLAHETCSLTGHTIRVTGQRAAELAWFEAVGHDGQLVVEAVGAHIDRITDLADANAVMDPVAADAASGVPLVRSRSSRPDDSAAGGLVS